MKALRGFGFLGVILSVLVGCSSGNNSVADTSMEEIYSADGECIDIVANGLLVVPTGFVDIETGALTLETTPISPHPNISARIAQNGRFVSVRTEIRFGNDRLVYDLETGEQLDLPDGRLIDFGVAYVLADDGLYDVQTGTQVVDAPHDDIYVSGDAQYMIIAGDGVYEGSLDNQLFALPDGEITVYTDGMQIVWVHSVGIFRIPDGEQIISLTGSEVLQFLNGLVHVGGDAFYDIETGVALPFYPDRLANVTPTSLPGFTLNDDAQWIAVNGEAVYAMATGEQVLTLDETANRIVFSDDGRYVAVGGDGVYDITTGDVVLDIEGTPLVFTPTSTGYALLVNSEAVYQIPEGDVLIPLETSVGNEFFDFRLVNDDSWLIMRGIGGYNLDTGEKLFDVPTSISVPPSRDALLVADVGVFDYTDGTMRYELSDNGASPTLPADYGANGEVVWVLGDGVYDFVDGTRLLATEDEQDTIHLHPTAPIIAYTTNALTPEAQCTLYRYTG